MKTTFSRTFFTTAIILLLALLLVGTSFQALVRDYLTESTITNLQNNSTAIAELAAAYYTEGSLLNWDFMVNLDVASQVTDSDVVICNAQRQVMLCSDSITGCAHQGLRVDEAYMNKVIENGGDVATGLIRYLYEESRYVVSTPITDARTGENLGIVVVSRPTVHTTEVLDRISSIFLLVSVLVMTISVVAMLIITHRQSDPLKQVAVTARAFGHGNLNARVRLKGDHPEEVEELALAFNNMAAQIQKSDYQRREFVANVSHELKTPMTTISGYVDGILDGTIPESRRDHYLRIVSDETKRLSRLVRSMLDISLLQDEEGIPEDKKTHFDMEETIGQVLITFEQKINDKDLNVEVDMPEHPVYTHAAPDYVTQVVYNLIDNAVKFCPQGGTLGLKLTEGREKIHISISNQGETIPPEELPLVFDRFHKMDKSRSQNRDGWGLGLYIVKTIVCSHGENISVSSRDGKTEFTFTLPLVN